MPFECFVHLHNLQLSYFSVANAQLGSSAVPSGYTQSNGDSVEGTLSKIPITFQVGENQVLHLTISWPVNQAPSEFESTSETDETDQLPTPVDSQTVISVPAIPVSYVYCVNTLESDITCSPRWNLFHWNLFLLCLLQIHLMFPFRKWSKFYVSIIRCLTLFRILPSLPPRRPSNSGLSLVYARLIFWYQADFDCVPP